MSKNTVMALIITALSITVAAPAFPAEELFDTTAATKHIEQGVTFLKAKKFDAAIKEFEESAAINPDAEAYYYLGYAYYLKGRSGDEDSRKKSREYFDKAYEINPHFSPAQYKPDGPAQSGEPMQKEEPAKGETNIETTEPTITHPLQPVEPIPSQPTSQPTPTEQPKP